MSKPRRMKYELLCLLATFVMNVGAQRNPSISFISKQRVVNIGDTLELKCQVQDAENYPVAWTKLGRDQHGQIFISKGKTITLPSTRHHIRYEDSDSTYTLVIEKIQEIDVGTYRCEITTGVNTNVSICLFVCLLFANHDS